MKATTRNAKGSVKHNSREFNTDKANHIDKTEIQNNMCILDFGNGLQTYNLNELDDVYKKFNGMSESIKNTLKDENQNRFNELSDMEKVELYIYNAYLQKSIKSQNERHIASRHLERQKDVLDVYLSQKTEPTETIIQVGNVNDRYCVDKLNSMNELSNMYAEYRQAHNQKYGSNIILLDTFWHGDEPGAAIHAHERKLFIGHNKNGEIVVNKNQALKEMGVKLPNPNAPETKYNNRLITYSEDCHNMWIDICKQHGFEIETTPKLTNPDINKPIAEFKKQTLQKQNDTLKKEYDTIQQKINAKNKEYDIIQTGINVGQSRMRSQEHTIKYNNEVIDKQKEAYNKYHKAIDEQIEAYNNNEIVIKNQNQTIDELSNRARNTGIIEKKTLDLLWDKYPDLVEDYQNRAEEQINNAWKPTPKHKAKEHIEFDDMER